LTNDKSPTPIKTPSVPKALPPAELPRDLPADGETNSQLEYQHLDLAKRTLSRPHFEQVIFRQLTATESSFLDLRLEDVRFSGCNLANAEWHNSVCARAEFIGCRMTGFITLNAQFLDTAFRDCKGDLAQFYQAKMLRVQFVECPLVGADFREADLTGVVFAKCDLTNTDFRGATLAGADIRGCAIDGMRAGPLELRGAIVDEVQALALVRAMGITIA
jgi:uncharacterized protein YjbI with pentapeptide repeats